MTTAIAQALSAALLHFVWQGLLVAFVLWVALFVLRNRSAHSRYLSSCMALAVLALLPAVTTAVLYVRPAPVRTPVLTASATPAGRVETKRDSSPQFWLAAWQSWAVPVWSVGVLLFSIRLVWGCKQVSSMRRRGTPAETPIADTVSHLAAHLGITRPVNVLMTAVADGPSVVGWIRPVVLLPSATLLGLTPEQLEAVLAHELAHIRRHDYLVNVVQILLETLLFYHPAVWWISARIRDERELCCDDLAVSSCGDALCYARALTKLERLRLTAPQLALAGAGGPLMYRIQRLIGAKQQGYGPSKLSGIVALCLGLACFAINVHWAKGQSQEQPKAGRYVFLRAEAGQERDAAGVTVDTGTDTTLRRSSVEFPRLAVEKSIQGTVTLEATIDAAGGVSDARVLSGPSELRRAALQSLLEWRFQPDPNGNVRIRQINIQFDAAAAQQQAAAERAQSGAALERGTYTVMTSDGPRSIEARSNSIGVDNQPSSIGFAQTAEEQERLEERIHQLENLREQLRDLREREFAPQVADANSAKLLDAQAQELQSQLAKVEALIEHSMESRSPGDGPDTLRTRANIGWAAEREGGRIRVWNRDESPNTSEQGATASSERFLGRAVGHRLARIDVLGLSEEARKSLVSQLPVHIGDILSEGSIDGISAAIRNFDEHQPNPPGGSLRAGFKSGWTLQNFPTHTLAGVKPDADDWILQIVAPNFNGRGKLIQK